MYPADIYEANQMYEVSGVGRKSLRVIPSTLCLFEEPDGCGYA